ncbi:transglycosylase domain-containing protein [Stackebrandtia soli]|uniref:transglycosylase domain-containing protein n=1 Tax=Stackebrandtia soli TaxID=1892856 RepID=UPI0039EB76C7
MTSGRARVPGSDSTGPARGTARVGAKRRGGRALSDEEAEALRKANKKKKRRRRLIALSCVLAVFLGGVTVVGSIFFESVPVPEDIDFDQNATILYAGGEEMATVGSINRKVASPEEIPDIVEEALIAAEDRTFRSHPGVDFWGVMRAVWNNVTGGDTQGASTLTQQYVGAIANIRGDDSYLRKAREAVMAMKIGDTMSKDEILNAYLNLMPFGRQAYGVGAAAEAFFGKDITEISVSEAALLIAQLKGTGGQYDPDDPTGLYGDEARKNAEGRWNYVLDSLVEVGKLDKAERDEITKLPKTEKPNNLGGSLGADKPTGFISHDYALQEASEILDVPIDQIGLHGYTITTTINKDLQDAAKAAAGRGKNSYMKTLPDNLAAGLVAVDPATGAILAYYGGPDGTGIDKAGHENMHPPGSSFKEFTMIAALEAGMSIESLWDGTSPRKFAERGEAEDVVNSGNQSVKQISMKDAIIKSLNTPIYAMTNKVGAATVAQVAAKMGITKMVVPNPEDRDGDRIIVDLTTDERLDPSDPRALVDNEIGFGQYPVSVHDMAVANATLAAQGVYHKPHFVQEIKDGSGEVVYDAATDPDLEGDEVVNQAIAADATFVSSSVWPNVEGDGALNNGQRIAGKTGTWERHCPEDSPNCDQNSAVWYAGFTPQISAAVWVGDKESENGVVLDEYGANAYGSGPSGTVWSNFMNKAVEVLESQPQPFPERGNHGDADAGELGKGKPPEDEDDKDDEKCRPGDPRPKCNEGGEQCVPGTPGYPDCNGDGVCDLDPADPACQVPPPDGTCDPTLPGDPDCTPPGGDENGTDDAPRDRQQPLSRSTDVPGAHDEPMIREDYARIE